MIVKHGINVNYQHQISYTIWNTQRFNRTNTFTNKLEFLTIILNDIVFVIGQMKYITIIMKPYDKIFKFINNISVG